MSAGTVLRAAGVTKKPTPTLADLMAAFTYNVLEDVPGSFVGPAAVVHGALANGLGGRQTDMTKPQRVSVFLGPRATLRGVVLDIAHRTRVPGHAPADPFDDLL